MGNEDNPWGNIVIQQPSTEGEKITPSSTTISYQDIIDEVEDLTLKSRLEQISESYRNRIITFVQNNFVYNGKITVISEKSGDLFKSFLNEVTEIEGEVKIEKDKLSRDVLMEGILSEIKSIDFRGKSRNIKINENITLNDSISLQNYCTKLDNQANIIKNKKDGPFEVDFGYDRTKIPESYSTQEEALNAILLFKKSLERAEPTDFLYVPILSPLISNVIQFLPESLPDWKWLNFIKEGADRIEFVVKDLILEPSLYMLGIMGVERIIYLLSPDLNRNFSRLNEGLRDIDPRVIKIIGDRNTTGELERFITRLEKEDAPIKLIEKAKTLLNNLRQYSTPASASGGGRVDETMKYAFDFYRELRKQERGWLLSTLGEKRPVNSRIESPYHITPNDWIKRKGWKREIFRFVPLLGSSPNLGMLKAGYNSDPGRLNFWKRQSYADVIGKYADGMAKYNETIENIETLLRDIIGNDENRVNSIMGKIELEGKNELDFFSDNNERIKKILGNESITLPIKEEDFARMLKGEILPNIKNVLPKLEEFIKMHPAIPDSIQNKALVRLQYLKYVGKQDVFDKAIFELVQDYIPIKSPNDLLSIKINADEVISSEDLKTLRKQAIEKNNRGPNPILTKIKDYLLKTTEGHRGLLIYNIILIGEGKELANTLDLDVARQLDKELYDPNKSYDVESFLQDIESKRSNLKDTVLLHRKVTLGIDVIDRIEFMLDLDGKTSKGDILTKMRDKLLQGDFSDDKGNVFKHGTEQELVDDMEKWLKENSSKYSDIPDNTLSSIKSRLDLLNEFKSKYFSAISNENFAKLRGVLDGSPRLSINEIKTLSGITDNVILRKLLTLLRHR